MTLKLEYANAIIAAALDYGASTGLKPLAVVVLDGRGALVAAQAQDGVSLMRSTIAFGKANGAVGLGMGSRALMARAEQQPYFINAINGVAGGALVPVPGGVLIKDGDALIGAVGISGDTSDNDEAAAVAGIAATPYQAETG